MGINARVLERNAYQPQANNGNGVLGVMMQIPCGASISQDADYWAVPQKTNGIFTRLNFVIYTTGSTAPTYDSFRVFRISDRYSNNNDYWVVRGTMAQYNTACADCCGGNGSTLPTDVPFIVPCQALCAVQNSAGAYQAIFGIPTLLAGQTYHPYVAINNVKGTPANPAGYNNVTALLGYLNTSGSGTNIGSPSVAVTWTASPDNMTLIATTTGDTVGSSICAVVNNFYTSP